MDGGRKERIEMKSDLKAQMLDELEAIKDELYDDLVAGRPFPPQTKHLEKETKLLRRKEILERSLGE